ncbi:MAG: class I SAM-dependent methyltransferase [Candidatus Nanopelagicales bacterium]
MVEPGRLRSAEARALETALAALPPDPLARVSQLRRQFPDADPDLVAACATQARLREQARGRLDPWVDDLILSDAGLQQATRAVVARHRAGSLRARLATDGVIADLGCGLGIDSLALAEAGFEVEAIESDPWTAAAASLNTATWTDRVRVRCADVADVDLDGCAAAFCDPARRSPDGPANRAGTRTPAEADPRQWSPPWPWVVALSARLPVVAKAAPGMSPAHVPGDAEIEWIACDGELVEACVWFAPLARNRRRATAISRGLVESVTDEDHSTASMEAIGTYLLEPSPAVRRASLVDALAARLEASRVSHHGSWLTSTVPRPSVLARTWHVVDEVPAHAAELRERLRHRGSVTWKTRDVGLAAADMDAQVGHRPQRQGAPVTIAWIRGDEGPRAFEVEPVSP